MHGNDPLFHDAGDGRREPEIPNGLLRVAGVFAIALLFASQLPSAAVPALMSQMLTIAAFVTASIALLSGESVQSTSLTRWDEAAILFGLAFAAALLTDREAALEAMQALEAARK